MGKQSAHPSYERLTAVAAKLDVPAVGPSAIAKWLNVSPQLVKNWERRGVSRQGALLVQAKGAASAHWLLDGAGLAPAPPPPQSGLEPWQSRVLADLASIGDTRRKEIIAAIERAALDAQEAREVAGHQPVARAAAARRGGARRSTSSSSLGDGNRLQGSLALPLATVPDPWTAAPSDRESVFYRNVEGSPKATKSPKDRPTTARKVAAQNKDGS